MTREVRWSSYGSGPSQDDPFLSYTLSPDLIQTAVTITVNQRIDYRRMDYTEAQLRPDVMCIRRLPADPRNAMYMRTKHPFARGRRLARYN